jgi:arylamine N-acetyltransferase
VTFSDGSRWITDVAFGGDGPTEPIEIKDGASITNLGTQSARLRRGFIPEQTETCDPDRALWIYECRNHHGQKEGTNSEGPWHAFYCFSDKVEWSPADFGVSNWYTGCSPESFQTRTVLVVKFLRRAKSEGEEEEEEQEVYGKRMMMSGQVKENLGGRTKMLMECRTEEERLKGRFGVRRGVPHLPVPVQSTMASTNHVNHKLKRLWRASLNLEHF